MVDLGTRTLTEVARLAADTARLVRSRGVLLATWACLGWALHQAGLFASALLGVRHGVAANLVFVLAVVAELVTLVLMVHTVRPASVRVPADPGGEVARLAQPERTLDVVTLAVGPFLAVYAVWGFLDDEVSALFRSNYVLQGLGGVQDWSISLSNDRLPFYLGLAAAGWLLRAGVQRLLRWRRSTGVAAVGVLAEGVWALSVFVVLVVVVRVVRGWLRKRVVWAELTSVGQSLLSLVPSVQLPFGPTTRELAAELVGVAPAALATVLGLPLMWLALVATVYGWRDVRAADVVAGTRAASRLERWSRYGTTPLGRLLLLATGDLRTKYLPVASALRLVGRAGPRLVGAYLLLATVLNAVDQLLQIGVSVLPGPQTPAVTLLLEPGQDLLVTVVVDVASVCLYGAVFARAVRRPGVTAAAAASGPRRPAAAGPQGARPGPSAPRS